jgi:magnesium transporter
VEKLKLALAEPAGLLWVNLERPDEAEANTILKDVFNFHPLSIEDCLSTGYQPPKVDDFGNSIFLIIHALHPGKELSVMETHELNLFLGKNYLVTCYLHDSMPAVDHIWQRLQRDNRLHSNGADFLCHAVLDKLVDEYMPVIDHMDDEIDWLEDQVLAKPNPVTLERVLSLKHSVMALRRILSPQREVINRLARDEFSQIDRQTRIYFRDIYDHLVRIQDLSESIRDIVTGALDIHLSSTSLRLNEIMRALTVVSTIFLPLSFQAGVYGTNFKHFPELEWGYPWVWLLYIGVAAGFLLYFKHQKWLRECSVYLSSNGG